MGYISNTTLSADCPEGGGPRWPCPCGTTPPEAVDPGSAAQRIHGVVEAPARGGLALADLHVEGVPGQAVLLKPRGVRACVEAPAGGAAAIEELSRHLDEAPVIKVKAVVQVGPDLVAVPFPAVPTRENDHHRVPGGNLDVLPDGLVGNLEERSTRTDLPGP